MSELLKDSMYFGLVFSLGIYFFAVWLNKKVSWTILNPLLITTIIIISLLSIFKIDFSTYNIGAKYLNDLLLPATVCLAVPMYKQLHILLENKLAVFLSILSGCLACAATIFLFGVLFKLDKILTVSLLPKSITTAIAIGVSEEIGGNSTITVAAVIITGLFGAMILKPVCKIFHITEPAAVGLMCGNSAHAIGTSKALELGEIEGAMSSVAIIIAGIMTVLIAPFIAAIL